MSNLVDRIPVARPWLGGNEESYVLDCVRSSWISSQGKYIGMFETAFAALAGARYAASCCNGTVALHLALLALGIGPGDEVIMPSLTYIATANAARYCGARPVFVDSEPDTWNMDPRLIKEAITERTRAVIPVHLYGQPCDMRTIDRVATAHGLKVLEDAAEAHGALCNGKPVGSLGDIAAFSFFGNKIITCGEGGMVTTDDESLWRKVVQLKSQGVDPERRYWFPIVGYNYRMTNIEAAIGLAQVEKAEFHMAERRRIASLYDRELTGIGELQLPTTRAWADNVFWMYSVVLRDECSVGRDAVIDRMAADGVETRPFFYPIHTLPPYAQENASTYLPVAEKLGARGMNLPTFSGMTEEQVVRVCTSLKSAIRGS